MSSENVILDFANRRTSREIAAQVEVLALARQRAKQRLSQVVPGVISGARVIYSAISDPSATSSPGYTLQRGDLFQGGNVGSGGPRGDYMNFSVDTKTYKYILREGETKVLDFLRKLWD